MQWQNLLNEIDARFPYLEKIQVSSNGLTPALLHPVLKFSTGIVISAIFEEKTKRIVLVFPNKFNLDKWINILAVLELLRNDYFAKQSFKCQFERGQKLLFNNKCIVEFDGVEEDKLWIRAADNNKASNTRFSLSLKRVLHLQPVDRERKLSSVRKVRLEYSKIPESPLDSIIDIYTAGNKSLFEKNLLYVGRIGKTNEFINNCKINKTKLVDLFLWGKLNTEGSITIINPQKVKALPSCIIAPDLYSAINYIDYEENKTRGIIISSPSFCKNDPHSLSILIDSKIPIIVIADFNDLDDLEYLVENNFLIWQWNENNLKNVTKNVELPQNSIFTAFQRTLSNMCNQKINTVACSYPELESIANELTILEKEIRGEQEEFKILFSYLYKSYNEFARLIRFPTKEWLSNFRERIKNLQYEFETQKLWLSPDAWSQIKKIIFSFLTITENPFNCEDHKLNQLEKILKENPISGKTIVILPADADVVATKHYWQKRFSDSPETLNNIVFLSANDLSHELLNFVPDRFIVCGWLGQFSMLKILHSFITDNITLLLYPKEDIWFKSAKHRWRKKRKININYKEFTKLLNINEDLFDEKDIPKEIELPEESLEEDILELERRLRQYRYASYKAKESSGDTIEKAKLVIFNNEQFAFFTKTHKCLVVTELLRENNPEIDIQKLTLSDLKFGDYILIYNSDKDLIREIADKILKERGKPDLRAKATFWKKILIKKTREIPFDSVISVLRQKGCNRHKQTIKNWLLDEDIIGPADLEDIKRILKAFAYTQLKDNFDKIINEINSAISEVRGAHLQASSLLAKHLLKKLPEIISMESEISKPLVIEIADFGHVHILKIEEITKDWFEVEKRNTNRILS